MHGRRRGIWGRFPIQPRIGQPPKAQRLIPHTVVDSTLTYMNLAEAEVLGLVDLQGLCQEETGMAMGLFRGTIWRLLTSARGKMVLALYEGRPLIIGHQAETE